MTEINRIQVGQDIESFRRVLWQDMIGSAFRGRSTFEISSIQLMTLFILEEVDHMTVNQLADKLGRSVSATSRMVDQLVGKTWLLREEDSNDRRTKRLTLSSAGRAFLRSLEQVRIETQLALIDELSSADQVIVAQAMHLLAEAARRRQHESADSF